MLEIIPQGFYYDFVGRRKLFANISWALFFVSLVLFFVVEPNWSIDFTGGTEVEVRFQQATTVEEVRNALRGQDVGDEGIQQVQGEETRFLVRTRGETAAKPEDVEAVRGALNTAFGAGWVEDIHVDAQVGSRLSVLYKGDQPEISKVERALSGIEGVMVQSSTDEGTFYVRLPGLAEGIAKTLRAELGERGIEILRTESVGPKVGGNLRTAGIISLGVTMLFMLFYIAVRFDFAFAPGAILCLLHDTVIVIGFWVATQQEFGLPMISALLTLLGYQIDDTIVVYDRIRENLSKYRRADFGKLINDSINQTLSRTVVTAGGTMLSMIPFLIWGGPVLFQFAEAMLIGILVGTYSSIYVAAPMTMILQENRESLLKLVGLGGKAAAQAPRKAP